MYIKQLSTRRLTLRKQWPSVRLICLSMHCLDMTFEVEKDTKSQI